MASCSGNRKSRAAWTRLTGKWLVPGVHRLSSRFVVGRRFFAPCRPECSLVILKPVLFCGFAPAWRTRRPNWFIHHPSSPATSALPSPAGLTDRRLGSSSGGAGAGLLPTGFGWRKNRNGLVQAWLSIIGSIWSMLAPERRNASIVEREKGFGPSGSMEEKAGVRS